MSRLGIVVPAYRPDTDRLVAYVRELVDRLDPEAVRVELDAPRSDVADRLRSALHDAPVEVNAVDRRRGKGAAVTAGFEALEADVLGFSDADGSTPAGSFAEVVSPVQYGDADLAVGSRRHPDAVVHSHQTFARRHMGDVFARLARRFVGADLHDYQCGAKAITAEAWREVRGLLHESGFAWDLELVAVTAALDRRITEVPVAWEDQPGSTVAPVSDGLRLLGGLFRARHRAQLARGSRLHRLLASRDRSPPLVDRVARDVTREVD